MGVFDQEHNNCLPQSAADSHTSIYHITALLFPATRLYYKGADQVFFL